MTSDLRSLHICIINIDMVAILFPTYLDWING